jgi:hypothetical protein
MAGIALRFAEAVAAMTATQATAARATSLYAFKSDLLGEPTVAPRA